MFDNEEDIKVKLVYDFLRESGIDRGELSLERSFNLKLGRYTFRVDTEKQADSAQPRLDILFTRDGKPLCVVEVKRDSAVLTQDDTDQAVSYGRLVDPMVPFCIVTNGREFKAIDTITKDEIRPGDRQTSKGYTIRLPDEDYYEAVKCFLGYSRENLLRFCEWQVEVYTKQLTGSSVDRDKKFIPELYEPPENLVAHTKRFIDSSSAAFIVGGDAGRGKTCWSCHIARSLLNRQHPALFFRAAAIRNSVLGAIGDDLNLNLSPQSTDSLAAKRFFEIFTEDRVVIIVDGIDEIDRGTAVELVDEFLRKTSGGRVKLILTCKTSALEDFLEYLGTPTYLSETAYVIDESRAYIISEIENEQFNRMVNRYRHFFHFEGLFEHRVADDCKRNPFLLRVMFEVASDQGYSHLSYSSLEFYEQFYRKTLRHFLHRESIEAILSATARCLYEENTEQVDIDVVRSRLGLSVLQELPTELFERSVLTKSGANSHSKIGFYFNLFRDYVVAYKSLKWQDQTKEQFLQQIDNTEISGVRLDTLNLYYSLAKTEHKRALDEPVFENALRYVTEYESILDTHFSAFKGAFPPYSSVPHARTETLGFVGYFTLSNRRIIYRGFRLLQPGDERVKLFPLATMGSTLGNVAYLSGGRDLMFKGTHRYFRDIDIAKEVWEDVSDDLNEITKRGLLSECHSRVLLEERLLAVSASHYKDTVGIRNTTVVSKSLPLSLDLITYAVLYRRALTVLEHESREEKIRLGTIVPRQKGNLVSYSVSYEDGEHDGLKRQADTIARRGEYKSSNVHFVSTDEMEASVLNDLACLQRLGVDAITRTIRKDWEVAGARDWIQSWNPTTMIEMITEFYVSFFSEYRAMAETNFPTLYQTFPFYQRLPITCFLRFENELSEPTASAFFCSAEKGQEDLVIKCTIDDLLSTDEPQLVYKGKRYRWFEMRSCWPRHFLSPSNAYMPFAAPSHLCVVRSMVYKEIRSDLNQCLRGTLEEDGIKVDDLSTFWP